MTTLARAFMDEFTSWSAVDTNCHIGQWPYRLGAAASADDLGSYAKEYELSQLWVSHLAALFGFDTRTANEACLQLCANDDRLVPFAVINPAELGWQAELDWACATGFSGVRIAPGWHGYELVDALPLLQVCAEMGLLLQIILRLDDARVRHPRAPMTDIPVPHVADFIRELPDTPLVLSGLNWAEWLELRRQLADEIPPHVRADTWHMNGPTGVADQWAADPERWVFGSGLPVQAPEPTILQLAVAQLEQRHRSAIARESAAAILLG